MILVRSECLKYDIRIPKIVIWTDVSTGKPFSMGGEQSGEVDEMGSGGARRGVTGFSP